MAESQSNPDASELTVDEAPGSEADGQQKELKQGLVLVSEGYYKYTDVLFDWPKCLSGWHRNAVKALLNGDVLVLDDHPLHIPGRQGIELYLSTAANGHQKLLFSLKQLEYLQYYIHEHKLADPRVVKGLMGGENAGWPEDFDFDGFTNEGRIPLPLNVLLPSDLGEIRPVNCTSLAGIKSELARIGKHNKSVKRDAMLMRPMPSSDRVRTEAELDNEREGPGLRKGPIRRRRYDWGEEEEEKIDQGSGQPDVWADYPPLKATGELPSGKDDASSDPNAPGTPAPASPDLSDSLADSINLLSPPSVFEKHEPDTPTEHYYHAQQALLLASLGGLVAALHRQAESSPEGEPTDDEKKIGRSLFIALDVVTSEIDESIVLEIGWSALWWQPVKPGDLKGEFEEMRDQGHYVVQDHLLTVKTGQVKPDHRDKYRFGTSLPIKSDEVSSKVSQLLTDLSKKAGSGPTYLVLHFCRPAKGDQAAEASSDKLVDLMKIGLFPHEFHQTLRPTSTQYPIYSEMRGIGRTSIINTAVLHEELISNWERPVEGRRTTPASLEDVASRLFAAGDERAPMHLSNAGNSASCTLEIMLSLLMEHDPGASKNVSEFMAEGSVKESTTTSGETSMDEDAATKEGFAKRPANASTADFVEVKEHDSDASHQSDSDSDAGGIQGVYFEDDEGGLVEYDEDDKDA